MSKFIYRMQGILNIKEKMEEQAKMEFSAARVRLDEEEARLGQLCRRKEDYEEEGRKLREAALNVRDLRDNKEAMDIMDDYIGRQRKEVAAAEDRLEEARVRLRGIMQERKTHERLKEKAFEDFVRDENAREGKETDERVSYTYGQKRR